MKKDLAVVGDFELRSKREQALESLFSSFLRDMPLSLETIEEMWECLTPEEQDASYDSVVMMRVRALMAELKEYQAYQALVSGLKIDPLNMSLQLELENCLGSCHRRLEQLLGDDPQNPLIEILYVALLKEAHLTPVLQGRYLNYLIRQGRFREAADLAKPLVALLPAMVGLRDSVEVIAGQIADPAFTNFLSTRPAKSGRRVIRSKINAQQALALTRKFRQIQEEMPNDSETNGATRILREVLGDFNELSDIDLTYKDFYYFWCITLGDRGRNWEALTLLHALVEADPCHLYYRRALDVEIRRFCQSVEKKAEKNELRIDLKRAHAVLREVGIVPYTFLKQVSLSEVAAGQVESSKTKMDDLMKLNPYDGDYLLAALDVAIEAKNQEWMGVLLAKLEELKKARPWKLRFVAVGEGEAS